MTDDHDRLIAFFLELEDEVVDAGLDLHRLAQLVGERRPSSSSTKNIDVRPSTTAASGITPISIRRQRGE